MQVKSIKEIRRAYPSPVSYPDFFKREDATPFDAYCVGGALCLAHRDIVKGLVADGFPNAFNLAKALGVLNRQLDSARAYSYAWKITLANDAGKFEDAWTWAEKALVWGQPWTIG